MTNAADRRKAASDVRWARAVEAAENKTHARLARMAEAGAELVRLAKAAVDEEGRRYAYFVGAPELREAIVAFEEASK